MTRLKADELAVACADSMYEKDIAAQEVGITLEEVKSGYARLKMIVRPDMLNGHDVCHGGFLFMLADTAFAYACNSYNKVTYAQSCDIDFVHPGEKGDDLIAIAEERVRGRRMGLYDVTVSRADGEVLAYFRGRSYQVKGALLHE